MIKNQRQYAITQSEIARFRHALAQLETTTKPEGISDRLWTAQRDGVASQLQTLEREAQEFEALQSGLVDKIEVRSLDDLPRGLIKARIARGLTHQQLADRLGVKPQQVQRWENLDYENVGFNRLVEIAAALDVEVSESILLRSGARTVLSDLKSLGIDRAFLRRRFAPQCERDDQSLVEATVGHLKRIWGLLVANGRLDRSGFACDAVSFARFKLPRNADAARVRAYAQYAHFIADRVLEGVDAPQSRVPSDWRTAREHLVGNRGLNLRDALMRTWDWGVPVIPLSDPVRFHGVCWSIAGRNVIVLKQSVRSEARWLFDLCHELFHAAEEEPSHAGSRDDLDPTSTERRESEEERAANDYAGNVLLGGRADALYEEALTIADRRVASLKLAVRRVATRHRGNVGVLANYVAHRLRTEAEIDWWGAAANLQPDSEDAIAIASDVFRERFNFSALSPEDRHLVELAISEPAI